MKKISSLTTLCLAVFIGLVFISPTYAENSIPFEKMSQAEKDKKYQELSKDLQDRIRRLQSGETMSVSPEEMKTQQKANEFLRKYAQHMQGKSNPAANRRKPVSREEYSAESERMRKQQQDKFASQARTNAARMASNTRKNDAVIGRWINSKGINLNLARKGFVRVSGYKSMYWVRKGSEITFYDGGLQGFQKGTRSPVTGLYNKSTDEITLKGTKFADVTFIRSNSAKGAGFLRAAIAADKEKRVRIILDKMEKRKGELKIKRDLASQHMAAAAELNSKKMERVKEFESTLKCKNCDLTLLRDNIFDCSWCEVEGSNFSKTDRLWSRYEFKWAKLKNSNFSGTSIKNTHFYKADLRGADFSGASIGQSNFAYANLEGANFRNAQIGESIFNGANLKNADFTGATIARTDFSFADIEDKILKSASLEDVKIHATDLDKRLVGVWQLNQNDIYKDIFYYEFFEDGTYIFTHKNLKRLAESDPLHRKFKEQKFYSIRKGAFHKITPESYFVDSSRYTKSIPTIQGGKLIFTTKQNSKTQTYTRSNGIDLAKYKQFRNTTFALRSAYYWDTSIIEKLSSDGVDYAALQDRYGQNIFDVLFLSYQDFHRAQGDRHIRYIFTALQLENKDFNSGSGFERMLFTAMKRSYVETLTSLLAHSSSKSDMKYALIKYKELLKPIEAAYRDKYGKDGEKSILVEMVEKRIAEL